LKEKSEQVNFYVSEIKHVLDNKMKKQLYVSGKILDANIELSGRKNLRQFNPHQFEFKTP